MVKLPPSRLPPSSESVAKCVRGACWIMGLGFAAITGIGFGSIFWKQDIRKAIGAGFTGAIVGGAFGVGWGYLLARFLIAMYKSPDDRK